MDSIRWQDRLEAERNQKDEFFAVHPQSPVAASRRQEFRGLDYYPPDWRYRFELQLHEHERKGVLQLEDTGGNMRKWVRWGEFRFEIEGRQYTLQAYKNSPEEERLFVPFRDETSGKETYGAGRYLDLEPERHLTAEDRWVVDFNEAYNPWCAYSKEYVCPLVPAGNWLELPVRAGEKNYSLNEE